MDTLLTRLGLHVNQQSLSNLWVKILGIFSLVAGGTLNVAWALQAGFGVTISMAANDRIKFWCVAVGVIVTYFTSQNTDRATTTSSSTMRLPVIVLAVLGAGMLLPACTAGGGLKIGKLDLSPTQVQTILSDASAGLADACASSGQTFPNAMECAIGTTALSGVAAAAANSTTPATAASAGITAAINTQPSGSQLLPYLQAAADLLPAIQPLIK